MVYGIKQCVCDKFSLSVGGITQKHFLWSIHHVLHSVYTLMSTVVIFATFSKFIFILIYFILFVLVHLFYLTEPFSYFVFNYLLFDQSYLNFWFQFCLMELFNLSVWSNWAFLLYSVLLSYISFFTDCVYYFSCCKSNFHTFGINQIDLIWSLILTFCWQNLWFVILGFWKKRQKIGNQRQE